jgi:pSer/pThr/pTyr-binding forkhead associated (FHA) protein
MPTLRVSIEGKSVDVPISKTPITIGRQPGLDLTVPAKGASREHLQIGRLKDGSWAAKDLASTNGTIHNGEPLATARLAHGDVLQIGNCRIEFLDPDAPVASPEPRNTEPRNTEAENADPEPEESAPIVLKSKKGRGRRAGADTPRQPAVGKLKRARKKAGKEAPPAEPAPPPEPEAPALHIENEEQLEGWLARRDEFDLLLAGKEKRVLFGK